MKKNVELLSPAGDMECLRAAVDFGADAVYVAGKQFGMRAAPSNFDTDELKAAVKYAHEKGVKLYVTCNTLPRNDMLTGLSDFLLSCRDAGVDALIISDMGVLFKARELVPDMELHVSTQAGIVNYEAANAMYQLGARRVVLARELSLEEIAGIHAKIPEDMSIECFAHGAMCMSFSGRCLLSNYMTGRDANQGNCAQPCRWEYDLVERQRPGQNYSIVEEDGENGPGTYIMNARDLNMIRHLPELLAAGVNSVKIEGRAKSAYYVASVTSAYRRALDFFRDNPGLPLPEDIAQETEKISHREYSTGFFFGDEPGQNLKSSGYIRDYEVVAVCVGTENGMVKLKQRNRFFSGSTADLLQPSGKPLELKLEPIYNEYMELIDVAPHAEMTVYLKTDVPVETGSYFRIRREESKI